MIAKGTGSSLADHSDFEHPNICQCEHGSTERIIQHPFGEDQVGSYHIRNDKKTNRPILVPKFRTHERHGFLQNSSCKVPQPQSRAAAAIRRFSNTFRRDSSIEQSYAAPRIIEMSTFSRSYETLSSELEVDNGKAKDSESPRKSAKFMWSRIQQNLGRDPPRATLTVLDQPLYRSGIPQVNHAGAPSHVPHDDFLNEIPRLPFPLISLPEAGMLQRFRRERGEEDHTEAGASFSSFLVKPRSATVSTNSSSQCPRTPLSTYFDFHSGSPHRSVAAPAPIHHSSRLHEVRTRGTCDYYCTCCL